ncbi:hypothetical protein Bca52824_082456 [Brassica carinata]|uniref:Uncharacterized protein n=1 Tax=Brassica carinata TaxID=52824 RepID=A0A8X7PJ70_BRACI|nr:hypothetical protein Bca52824_082456 [Brassica carinata]
MDAMMYIWREKTSLRRWNIDRVAFMNAMFCLQIEKEYEKCKDNKRGYEYRSSSCLWERRASISWAD